MQSYKKSSTRDAKCRSHPVFYHKLSDLSWLNKERILIVSSADFKNMLKIMFRVSKIIVIFAQSIIALATTYE